MEACVELYVTLYRMSPSRHLDRNKIPRPFSGILLNDVYPLPERAESEDCLAFQE